MILNKNISPDTLKKLSEKELRQLCAEVRRFLIKTVSKTGGHLASNLGTVELTVALHKVFSNPDDKIIFDVGHQCYTHKLLTGRFERFSTLRTEGGIGGFPRTAESEHDAFIGGHSGISVSAALGIAEAMKKSGDTHKAIAIAGDGAFTDGGIYEGINNAGKSKANLLVILNDNGMSISKNTGAIATYLSHLRSTRKYHKAKTNVKNFLEKNRMGEAVSDAVSMTKRFVKNAIYQSNFFEHLGFKYYGIVDGHNLSELIEVLELTKLIDSPCLIHVKTKKGKGFKPAERNSGEYHAATPAILTEPSVVKSVKSSETFSDVFGKEILRLAEEKEGANICLISAAMKYATGCNYFNDRFPDRFYDCGIAEGHAVTFAAGLASQGALPVFAVYSTFSQRSFDRLLHDCAIENLHVVLAIDRAGVVGEDGETHQGLFDVAMLSMIPNVTVFSPANSGELRECLKKALYETNGIAAVRYPRGKAVQGDYYGEHRLIKSENKNDKLMITYGRIIEKIPRDCDRLQLVRVKPLPEEAIQIAMAYNDIVFFEEGVERGGIGEAFLLELTRRNWHRRNSRYELKAFTGFVPSGDVETQLRKFISF
ncbi:MAG: 1-deoxy-D-xylulose-5-phosphate synthase [Oscillospiraceae bacterium]|nr:1-deoxy-D-xylulose-5-phosphate synthase [Oscillospiraceae bacterium]